MILTLKRLLLPLLLVVSLIPLLVYCYFFLKYTTNAPFYDDFYWGFTFLDKYLSTNSIAERFRLIFSQHSQHRIAYFRSIIVSYYYLFGTINFKHLAILGNISNIGIFFLLMYQLKDNAIKFAFILPISLILFQFQYYYNIITTYSLPNQGVYLWVIFSFYLLSLNTRKSLCWALLFATISVFSNGNGIISFPIIIFFLFLQKRFTDLWIALGIFCLILMFYFSNYVSYSSEITFSWDSVKYYFKFLSSAFTTSHNPVESYVAFLMFVLFLAIFSIECFQIFWNNKTIENPQKWIFASATILWILATAGAVTLYRVIHRVSVVNWYMIYSVLFMAFFVYFLLIYIKRLYIKAIFLTVLTGYGLYNYVATIREVAPFMQLFQSSLEADSINYKKNKYWSFLLPEIGSEEFEKLNKLSQSFSKHGIYTEPDFGSEILRTLLPNKAYKAKFRFQNHEYGNIIATLETPEHIKKSENIRKRYGFIVSSTNIYFFGTLNPVMRGKKEMIRRLKLFEEEPHFTISPKYFNTAIKKGEYQLGIVFIDNKEKLSWYLSDQTINIGNY